jgi:hypothetical protein
MSRSRTSRNAAVAALAGAMALVPVAAAHAAPAPTGPSTKTAPYVIPVAPGVTITSLLTAGDTNGQYAMVGIPDGLGATSGNGVNVDVLMNHELNANLGSVRAHGQTGAFVSRWTVNPRSGAVSGGSDLITTVKYWNYAVGDYSGTPSAFSRFCSSFLSARGQLLGTAGKGYDGQIYFANEENGAEARTFGVAMDGMAYQLPRLGLFSSENTNVAPTTGDATVVIGNEDDAKGQIRVYAGTKQSTGTAVDRAGLTNGTLKVLTVPGFATDASFRAVNAKGVAVPATFTEIAWNATGSTQNTDAEAKGISLNRIEDGTFDPNNPNDYYFLTTDGGKTSPLGTDGLPRNGGGLWKLHFANVNDPSQGATLTLLLDGSEAPYLSKPDNIAISGTGNILIQEDPGNDAHVARIVAYRISDKATGVVATFDPAQFTPDAAAFITKDEESSGIIDVSSLWQRPNTFLFDAQVHADAGDPQIVEKGQLLTLTVDDWNAVYAG